MKTKSSKKKTILIIVSFLIIVPLTSKFYLDAELSKIKIEGTNNTGKTIIRKTAFDIMANNSYMIISESGKVVVMDPYDMIPGPNPDLITVSHFHGDHFDEEYVEKTDCRKSLSKVERFEIDGIKMTSLASSHDDESINYSNPTNVIYCFEVDSLKIVHLGDFGQKRLTDGQKSILKNADVLIMPCQFNPVTKESINNILDDINPHIIFTTHLDSERFKALKKRISGEFTAKEKFAAAKSEIGNYSMQLVTLERDRPFLLMMRYLFYKFTGSNLFKIIIGFIAIVTAVIFLIKNRVSKQRRLKTAN